RRRVRVGTRHARGGGVGAGEAASGLSETGRIPHELVARDPQGKRGLKELAMHRRVLSGVVVGLAVMVADAASATRTKTRREDEDWARATPRLGLPRQHPTPVLTTRSPGAEDIRYGFEGGRLVKVKDTYHLFTSEMAGDPVWVKMRLGHWTSRDR